MEGFKNLLQSKKFWGLLIGIVAEILGAVLGLDTQRITEIGVLVIAYVLGQAAADIGKEKAKAENGGGK